MPFLQPQEKIGVLAGMAVAVDVIDGTGLEAPPAGEARRPVGLVVLSPAAQGEVHGLHPEGQSQESPQENPPPVVTPSQLDGLVKEHRGGRLGNG